MNPWAILITVGVVIGALTGTYLKGHSNGEASKQAEWDASTLKIERDAREAKDKADAEARAKEKAMADAKDRVQKELDDANKQNFGLRIANGRLVAAHGGLYDKNGKPVPGGEVRGNTSPTPGPDGPTPGCRLSEQVTQGLLDLALDADRVAAYADACHTWVLSITPQ
jgi:hypothetical protein